MSNYNKKQFEAQNKIDYNNDGYYVYNKKSSIFSALKKKKEKLLTVVTPVYNAEKYLSKTVDSVINQTIGFDNVEYILVDDGSNDNSRPMLLEYAQKYQNMMVVFLKENTVDTCTA